MIDRLTTLPDGRLDARGAAAYLGLSLRTLANKRSNGTGPRYVKAGRIFYYRADLDEWLQSRLATSTADARQRTASGSGDGG